MGEPTELDTINYELAERVAVVTGAGSGIGAACAHALARSGAHVVAADIDPDAATRVSETLPTESTATRVDTSDPESVDTMVGDTVNRFGTVHIMVNNAGIGGERAPVGDYSTEGWRRVLGINLDGVFYGTRAAIRVMRDTGGGSIVNMASILGAVGFPASGGYTTAKHGILGLTRAAALDHAADGVRVNAVGPGFIRTPMVEANLDPEDITMLAQQHPLGRLGTPAEVAELVAWLASDAARFVTGAYYPVDGGYLAR